MGGVTTRMPSTAFAARDVCRSFSLNIKQLRRVANRLWNHRNEIGYGDFSTISTKMKKIPGMPIKLSVGNISRVLNEENIALKLSLTNGEIDRAARRAIEFETKEIMKDLATAPDTNKIWSVIAKIITKTGIGSGCGVYEINQYGEIQSKERIGFIGPSRYYDWSVPKGEKAQIIFIFNAIAENYERLTGQDKIESKKVLKDMKFWHIQKRDEWPEFGLNRTVLINALEASGLNKLNSGFSGMFKSKKTTSLIETLTSTINEKLCLNDDLIDLYCGNAFKKFMETQTFSEPGEEAEIQKAYPMVLEKIKTVAKEALCKAFTDQERLNNSNNFLSSRGMKQLFLIINEGEGRRALNIFKQTVHNFTEALEDIEGDKERLEMTAEKGVPERIKENFYYLVTDTNVKPIALVLANKHEETIKTGKIRRIFEREEGKDALLETLGEIDETLTLALINKMDEKKLELDKKQADRLFEISNVMIDESKKLQERLFKAVQILQKLFKKNGETINSSIMAMNQENPDEMEVVATTRLDKTTQKPITWKINLKAQANRISGWVAQLRKNVFVANGKVFISGNKDPMSETVLEEIKLSNPKLFDEIMKITSKPKETFMTVPLIEGDDLLGVVNVDGAMLTEKDMNLLRSVAGTLTLAIKNSRQNDELQTLAIKNLRQNDELRKSLEERITLYNKLEIQSRTDELTRSLRRFSLVEVLEPAVDKVKKTPNDDLALLMTDIDNFKAVNDKYGHKNGDIVLMEVAKALKDKFGENVCRYGGEEFLIWLPHHSKDEGNMRGEEIREKISKMPIKLLDKRTINVTICIGISSLSEDYKSYEPDALDKFIDKADIAMFGAKEHIGVGRERAKNQCWKYTDEVGRQVEETRKNKQDALDKAREKILEATEALKKQKPETVARLLDDIEHQLNILRLHKRM